jgi:hypothetical protein
MPDIKASAGQQGHGTGPAQRGISEAALPVALQDEPYGAAAEIAMSVEQEYRWEWGIHKAKLIHVG